jgi:WD40 repeat protein/serine/threonine protein kinase
MPNPDRSFLAADLREREIFLDALERPPEERPAFLDQVCARDRALRAAVESLLEHHLADTFLEIPACHARLKEKIRHPTTSGPEKPGDLIRGYKLLEKIGEGGCGVVYMAQQEVPVRRRVALKILKLGMDTRQVIARFEAERQALALMDHPNIARVFDGGATMSGRPYFVMELVRGIRITDFCDENHLSMEERLLLFIQVCHAIQHAHQKGVIHRDIKPSNILVTLHDGVPVPKVIDFGIAKAIQQPLTDKTLFTQFQSFVGTPAYTSPEQAEMSGLDIDTRSDIYSLGVLLYQLLTGETPFNPAQLNQANLEEIRRLIREEEPKRPSTRLSTLGMAEATALVATRQTRFPVLMDTLRGDLDWIVMKCLEKDRSRRYETVNALALDVKRFLDHEPVLAHRPSAAYRIQKFIRRNRLAVGTTAGFATLLLLGTIVSTWLAIRATRAEREERQLHRTVEVAFKKEAELRQQAQSEQIAALRRAYNSDMNLVQQAMAANNYGRVMDLLSQHWPNLAPGPRTPDHLDFRQWEWRYFWAQSQSEAAFALPRQPGPVNQLALSPDARLLISASFGTPLKLWDVASRTELASIEGGRIGPAEPVFSHDGSNLAFAIRENRNRSTLRIWPVGLRKFTARVEVDGQVEALAFRADDKRLIAFCGGGGIRTWDWETGQISTRSFEAPQPGWGRRAFFSPDAHWLGIIERGQIRVLSLANGAEQALTDPLDTDIASLAFSPDGELLAAGPSFSGTNTSIALFATRTGKPVGQLTGHVSWVPDLAFTKDGKRLVSAGADQTLRIWDVAKRQELASLRGHRSEIYKVALNGDGQTIVTGCKDGTLYVWDGAHLPRQSPFDILPIPVLRLAFLPDSHQLLVVGKDHEVTLWDAVSLHLVQDLPSLGNHVDHLVIAPDGSRVYASTAAGLRVLDWATRALVTNLVFNARPVPPWAPPEHSALGLVDQGRTLVMEAPGGVVQLLDTATWQTKAEWTRPDAFFHGQASPLLSPNERWFVGQGSDGTAEFRNLTDGKVIEALNVQRGRLSAMALSPDSALLATSAIDGTVELWDTANRKLMDVLRGHLLGIESVAFSPDGQRLASTSHGNEAVKLWDVQTRHEVATLAGAGSLFRQAQFSPDGNVLAAINVQGQAHFWRAPALDQIDRTSPAEP